MLTLLPFSLRARASLSNGFFHNKQVFLTGFLQKHHKHPICRLTVQSVVAQPVEWSVLAFYLFRAQKCSKFPLKLISNLFKKKCRLNCLKIKLKIYGKILFKKFFNIQWLQLFKSSKKIIVCN